VIIFVIRNARIHLKSWRLLIWPVLHPSYAAERKYISLGGTTVRRLFCCFSSSKKLTADTDAIADHGRSEMITASLGLRRTAEDLVSTVRALLETFTLTNEEVDQVVSSVQAKLEEILRGGQRISMNAI